MAEKKTDKKKLFIIGVICAIILLNVVWTVLQNKFTQKLDVVISSMAKLEQRVMKLEQGGLPDVADLKQDFGTLKEIAEQYAGQLSNSISVEEGKLKALEAELEAQKSRVEAMKKLVPAK